MQPTESTELTLLMLRIELTLPTLKSALTLRMEPMPKKLPTATALKVEQTLPSEKKLLTEVFASFKRSVWHESKKLAELGDVLVDAPGVRGPGVREAGSMASFPTARNIGHIAAATCARKLTTG